MLFTASSNDFQSMAVLTYGFLIHSILSSREIDIVKLIGEGHTYKEIGKRLFIAEGTVRKHVEHIFEKTAVSNKITLLNKMANISSSHFNIQT